MNALTGFGLTTLVFGLVMLFVARPADSDAAMGFLMGGVIFTLFGVILP